MKLTVNILLCCAISLGAFPVAAATALLEVQPAVQLPGLSFEAKLSIRNDSGETLLVEPVLTMHARSDAGESWIVGHPASPRVNLVEWETQDAERSAELRLVSVEPRTTVVLVPSSGALVGDPHFLHPGKYFLWFEMNGALGQNPVTVRSPEVEYFVAEPQDEDRGVWERLKRFVMDSGVDGRPWFYSDDAYHDVSRYVFESVPNSGYFPYIAALNAGDGLPAFRRIEAAIERWPELPVTARNRALSIQVATNLLAQGDGKERGDLVAAVERNVRELSRSSNPAVRRNAEVLAARHRTLVDPAAEPCPGMRRGRGGLHISVSGCRMRRAMVQL